MYTIGTTPAPLSGAMSVTTSSTQTTITVRYNTIYTVTVGVNTTCAGVQEASATIRIGEWKQEIIDPIYPRMQCSPMNMHVKSHYLVV